MTDEQLRREAVYLHAALFGGPPAPVIADRYVAAHRTILRHTDPAQQAVVDRIVERGLDPVAVEFALRFCAPGHLASTKLRALIYLAETGEGYFDRFVSTRANRVQAWTHLMLAPARSAWLLAKGYLLVRRFRLA